MTFGLNVIPICNFYFPTVDNTNTVSGRAYEVIIIVALENISLKWLNDCLSTSPGVDDMIVIRNSI
jgi:hypothetical protein